MTTFPSAGIPKQETLADHFVQVHPTYDGRNTIVAILDTGVDPGAVGLQVTSDNKPKVIDVVDTTGSGDVDTSKIVKLGEDHTIEGLSGKKLYLNPDWNCPTGEYHVGLKAVYDLYPSNLVARLKAETKEKWMVEHREILKDVQHELSTWNEQHPNPTCDDIQQRNELMARLELLTTYSTDFPDSGMILDCVVFHDGKHWRAVVDTNGNGDLKTCVPMTNYRIERQYATLSDASRMNFAVNIYENGNVLCIVCDAGSHGTHVAGIVAANHPDHPEINGVAPGAQIVSVKIGDSRLGSMETGVGLMRGLLAVLENQCDIINMSYGEFSSCHNQGRIIRFAEELVDKHGIVFVSSAGNSGPALSTVGAPGGSSSCILGVGAYISPCMMEAEYSMRHQLPGNAYTWSSRGPTFDGDLGVNFCAPGGAIASVPNWTLKRNQLMNGTSMSSPNAAGNIALMISGFKDAKIPYNPYTIRRALQNTAKTVEGVEVFAQGRGLIQTTLAYDYLVEHSSKEQGVLKYNLTVASRGIGGIAARGIYIRDPLETTSCLDLPVTVEPIFHEKQNNSVKIEYELSVNLKSTQPWVSVANSLILMNGGRTFNVEVNCKHLQPGSHYAEVIGYDIKNISRGPIFRLPVTVVKPDTFQSNPISVQKSLTFCPGKIYRSFHVVPQNATWVDITIQEQSGSTEPRNSFFMFHALQTFPQTEQSSTEFKKSVTLTSGSQDVYSFPVLPQSTLECCLAQYWSTLGDTQVHMQIDFRGIWPDLNNISLQGGQIYSKVQIRTDLFDESIHPSVKLTKWQQKLRPESHQLSPLENRDLLPDGRQIYQLCLTYKIVQGEKGDVVPRFPFLNEVLYESQFESQMCMIFDENKKYMGTSDAFPKKIELNKGTYFAKLQIRHDDPKKLENLKGMICLLERNLKDVSMPCYKSLADLTLGNAEFTSGPLRKGKWISVFIGEVPSSKFPTGSSSGDLLTGAIYYGKKNEQNKGSGRKPGGFPISFTIPQAETKEKDPEPTQPKDTRTEIELADEAVRDLLIARLNKLEGKPEFDATYKNLATKYVDHLPLLQSHLHHLNSETLRTQANLPEIVTAATTIIALIPVNDLTSHYGIKLSDDPVLVKKRSEMDKIKNILIDALEIRLRAWGDLKNDKEFDQSLKELEKWVDLQEDRFVFVGLYADQKQKRYALALKRLNKLIGLDNAALAKIMSTKEVYLKKLEILRLLKWQHVVSLEERNYLVALPSTYTRF